MKANILFIGFAVLIFSFFTGCNGFDDSRAVNEKSQEGTNNVKETSVNEDNFSTGRVEIKKTGVKEQVDSEDTNEKSTDMEGAKSEETVENTSERIISFPNIFDAFTRLYSY